MGKFHRVEKSWGRESHSGRMLAIHLRNSMDAREETHLFGYDRFKILFLSLTASCRILRVYRVGRGEDWKREGEVSISWASLQNFL